MPAEPPVVIGAILQRLSDALLPLVALAVGLSLKFRLPRDELVPLGLGLALKLVLMPLAAWALVQVFAMPSAMGQASVLESAMPPMITAGALAISHRLAPGLAAALVGYGSVLALLSLPLWHGLLR